MIFLLSMCVYMCVYTHIGIIHQIVSKFNIFYQLFSFMYFIKDGFRYYSCKNTRVNVGHKKSNSNSNSISMPLQCKILTMFGVKVQLVSFHEVADFVRLWMCSLLSKAIIEEDLNASTWISLGCRSNEFLKASIIFLYKMLW